jgi:hypothetical protein
MQTFKQKKSSRLIFYLLSPKKPIMHKFFFSIITLLLTTSLYSQCWKSIGRMDGDTASTSFAIKENGTLWAWGLNNGLYGNGNGNSSAIPLKIGNDTNWKFINYSQSNVFGLKTDGTLWAWGNNGLGNGTTNSSLVPVQIGIENQWKDVSTAWGNGVIAIKNNGTIWCWGSTNDLTPTKIGNETDWKCIYKFYSSAYALKNNGTLWEIKWNWNGGNSYELIKVFNQIGNESDFKQVISNYAIKTDGSLFYYSNNSTPFLGAKQHVGSNTWGMISEGYYDDDVHGITTDGKLWKINNGVATQIGNESNWKEVTVLGSGNSSNYGSVKLALKTDGTLYSWGSECCGEFGNGYVDGLPIALPTIVNTPGCLVSIDEVNSSEFGAFPNPTDGFLNISLQDKIIESISIKNTEGRTVLFIQNPTNTIDIRQLENGIYFLDCRDSKSVWSKLIVKN